jgi:hypothetical protein
MSPKFRQILYVIGAVTFAALTVLSTFKVIDPGTAATVSAALTAVLGLFGVTISGTAAYNVTKQAKGGAFDPTDPATQVVDGLNQLAAQEAAVRQAKDAIAAAAQSIPVAGPILGPLAQQALDSL